MFKCLNEQEFVIRGCTEPKGSRKRFGALLMPYYQDGKLRYVGKVGTGFRHEVLASMSRQLASLEQDRPPFVGGALPRKGVHWVRPRLVCQIGFTERTRDGQLRHPDSGTSTGTSPPERSSGSGRRDERMDPSWGRPMRPRFFATPSEFRAWLEEHHGSSRELLVGYYKRKTGRPSITWAQSVDEALCFGWIDGVRKSIDDERYTIRFTPRKPRSNWSAVNIKRAKELIDQGLMRPAGLAAFEARTGERSAIYSYEQRHTATLDEESERRFRANEKAWEFFTSKPPSYRKAAIYWVTSAKKEETRSRRLTTLIEDSAGGRTVPPLTPPTRRN